jgi:hypothetical protein
MNNRIKCHCWHNKVYEGIYKKKKLCKKKIWYFIIFDDGDKKWIDSEFCEFIDKDRIGNKYQAIIPKVQKFYNKKFESIKVENFEIEYEIANETAKKLTNAAYN